MMTLEAVIVTIGGLDRAEVEHWIAQDWIRPTGSAGAWLFQDIDVARLDLIRELRHELRLEEEALSVVLHLMDQLYDVRRDLRRLRGAIERSVPPEIRGVILAAVMASGGEM